MPGRRQLFRQVVIPRPVLDPMGLSAAVEAAEFFSSSSCSDHLPPLEFSALRGPVSIIYSSSPAFYASAVGYLPLVLEQPDLWDAESLFLLATHPGRHCTRLHQDVLW